ncbi:MAG: protein-L-isoaspartate(D-aspartate) O-methyltransferase [Thermodesulfobacteriota bacterium]
MRVKKDIYERARREMVAAQIAARGIRDERVLKAMETVPRHLFVEEGLYAQAYSDFPLPIGWKQTISQPFMVALMTEAMGLTGDELVLEIGTGSGYQTAVLAMLARKVCSIERISSLAASARRVLDELHCSNVLIKVGDGTLGWPDQAPFDAIIVTAATPEMPHTLVRQLREGGRMVIPVGGETMQELTRVTRTEAGFITEPLGGCRFVKLVGKHGFKEEDGG